MRATIAALVLCLLLAAPAGAATLTATATPTADAAQQAPAVATDEHSQTALATTDLGTAQDQGEQELSTPETIDVQIRDDGHARFTIAKAYPAETDTERAAFERIADEFERGQYELGLPFFESVVDEVAEETGRSMSLTATNRETVVDDGTGRLIQEFTWTNYAVVSEERVEIEDAFQTGDGVWLRSLERDQELILRAPEGFGVEHSEPKSSVRGNAVIWDGPQTFQEGDFRTVFDRSESAFGNGVGNAWLLLGGLGVVLLLLTGYLLARRLHRDGVFDLPGLPTPSRLAGSIPDGGSETANGGVGDDQATPASSAAASESDDEASGGDEATGDVATPEDAEDDIDPELLSDEERVERLLERNGGRMKQGRIVDETGWSNAKVSQLLSEMAEEDKVDKLRIGRENLITLPDEDVTALE